MYKKYEISSRRAWKVQDELGDIVRRAELRLLPGFGACAALTPVQNPRRRRPRNLWGCPSTPHSPFSNPEPQGLDTEDPNHLIKRSMAGRQAELSWDEMHRDDHDHFAQVKCQFAAPHHVTQVLIVHAIMLLSRLIEVSLFFPWLSDLCADTLIICNERLHLFIGIKSSFNAL